MKLKTICGKVYGADLTRKEQEALEIAIRKQIAEQAKKYETDFDACVLYQIHAQYGKGAKALRKFYDDWKIVHKALLDHYELDKPDAPWLFAEKLKEIGADVEAWNREDADE